MYQSADSPLVSPELSRNSVALAAVESDDESASTVSTTNLKGGGGHNHNAYAEDSERKRGRKLNVFGCVGLVLVSAAVCTLMVVSLSVAYSKVSTQGARVVVLLSLDGFRASYLDEYASACPTLLKLKKSGASAGKAGMQPCFPTKTFPNHYSLVTGLYPAWHGIIANTMYDPVLNATFTISNAAAVSNAEWWKGEPLWNTNEKQGGISATMFWPGSEAPIGGMRPSYWYPYDESFPYQSRFDRVMQWLEMPERDPKRPNFISMYIDKIDTDGHTYGPGSPTVMQSISMVDAMIQDFVDRVAAAGLAESVQFIVSGDHGMAAGSRNRVVLLDDIINFTAHVERVVDWSPNVYIIPKSFPNRTFHENAILSQVAADSHLRGFRRADIPEVYEYRDSDRITPILILAQDGWQVTSRAYYERNPYQYDGGFHGMNNSVPDMSTIFIGHGSAFRNGVEVETMRNIEVYNVICQLLGLAPAPNNGTTNFWRNLLVEDVVG